MNTSIPDALIPLYNRQKTLEAGQQHEMRTFAARCHCQNVSFTVTLPTEILPLNAYMCMCSICRGTHGTFGCFHATLPVGIAPEWTSGRINLAVYKTAGSGAGGHGQRFFCPTCGAHNGHYEPSINQWVLDISLFEQVFWEYVAFAFPHGTKDGGMATWAPHIGGKQLAQLTLPRDVPLDTEPEIGKDGRERLRAECQCGGVSFTISRPNDAVRENVHTGQAISPLDPNKWKAFLDFSLDSRLVSSAHFTPWMLVPRHALTPKFPADGRLGTMKTYAPSPDYIVGFCGCCGATIMKSKDGGPAGERGVVMIAMGILKAPEGVRAESWVTWRTGEPAGVDEEARNFDAAFVDAMVAGHKEWGMTTYGEAVSFSIA
ncbi:Mss4-like protein [Xylariomycetidae sp. FL2044]|nr:Mss4-like protein [Xylariomycetidae sp. FL2044]